MNSACLVAAIALICLPACSPRPKKWDPHNLDTKYPMSSSIAKAKERGTLECEVEIIPNIWNYDGKEITFEAAWLERMPDGYHAPFALCFRIDHGKEVFQEVSSPILVTGDRGQGFSALHSRKGLQFFELLDTEDLSLVRVTLMRSWRDERRQDIRFVRKDKQPDK